MWAPFCWLSVSSFGAALDPLPPARFAEFLQAEHAKWGTLIREAGIQLE
jgi:hypothetical protein